MRDADWLVGWGCAATMYPTQMGPAAARVTITPRGAVKVQTAAHDIGTGAYTVVALTASDRLGIALDKVDVELGDTDLPPAPVAGGSNTTANVCNVVAKACDEIRSRIAEAAVAATNSPFTGKDAHRLVLTGGMLKDPDGASEPLTAAISRVSNGAIEVYAENTPHGVPPDGLKRLSGPRGIGRRRQDEGPRPIRVRRRVRRGPRACEDARDPLSARRRRLCRRTDRRCAHGQEPADGWPHLGRLVGAARSNRDRSAAGPLLQHRPRRIFDIPVNADVDETEVILIPEEDHLVNDLGIKGLGELGNVGTNAAVANAVYHATGVRIRELLIRLEKLLDGPTTAL
jgi:xanthine dehydrogenase YagR molybdenum-binding subunit